jgi:hypothetical protein
MPRAYFEQYLARNVQTVHILKEMDDVIGEFTSCCPVMLVSKCVDGRVHGSKGKGYPIGAISFIRTEGAKIDIDSKNVRLWEMINGVIADAHEKTPHMPALIISLGHYAKSDPHRSCAAHACDNAKALATVAEQTKRLREFYYDPQRIEKYDRHQVFFLHGMTNTDDMSESICFEHGECIDSGEIIDRYELTHPSQIFSDVFLSEPVQDPATKKYVSDLPVRDLLDGPVAPLYQDLKTALSMETFLLRRLTEIVNRKGRGSHEILRDDVFHHLYDLINSVRDLPQGLKGPLLYQTVWNIAYALYQRRRLETMSEEERTKHLDHAEELVCYGEGFETLARNKALLVKPGRGDEIQALTTAKHVLLKYSAFKKIPMVHMNVELTDTVSSWDSYRANVAAKLMRMKDNVSSIFGRDISILCTYSYKNEKQFYPVTIGNDDPRELLSMSIPDAFGSSHKNYTRVNFSHEETEYTKSMFGRMRMLEIGQR